MTAILAAVPADALVFAQHGDGFCQITARPTFETAVGHMAWGPWGPSGVDGLPWQRTGRLEPFPAVEVFASDLAPEARP